MFNHRFILIVSVLSLMLVTIAVYDPRSNASLGVEPGASDFHQRHPNWMWEVNVPHALIPVAGMAEFPDYYQRHPELRVSAGMAVDLSDYFLRHRDLLAPTQSDDLSDYFLRHPEINIP